MKAGIISLGCSRNLVDSEIILGSLKECGFAVSGTLEGADLAVVNTCAFIGPARKESVETVLEAAHLKKTGKVKYLIVAGCLSQMYKKRLRKLIPEADLILGAGDIHRIKDLLKRIQGREKIVEVSDGSSYLYDEHSPRFSLTPGHYAYVKIAEGCSNFCSYCIISSLRGHFRSRTINSIVREVHGLALSGDLKEVNLVGQDTTLFGTDIYGKPKLSYLLKRLAAIKNNVRWIRILYTHPAHYTDSLISVVRDTGKVCKYLDLPIQHISDKILKRMGRRTTKDDITRLIDKLKSRIPGLVLRTSIITGFPGEKDKDFKELIDFIRKTRFNKLGAFIYSKEVGTRASRFSGQVPEKIKRERLDELMKLQRGISLGLNKSLIGKRLDVLIDEALEGETGKFIGRTQGDAPEVDGVVYITGKNLKAGDFYNVKITDAMEYDLIGCKI